MSEPYSTPPALDPTLDTRLKALAQQMATDAEPIALKIHQATLKNAGITSPKIQLINWIRWINTNLVPVMQRFEGNWSDDPRDAGGPTCRGITLQNFQGAFNQLIVNSGTKSGQMAAALIKDYPAWRQGNSDVGKQFLYTLHQPPINGGLHYHWVSSTAESMYATAVATEDPYLAHLIVEGVWGSGTGGLFANGYAGMWNGWARNYIPSLGGYAYTDANAKKFSNGIIALGDRTPEAAMTFLAGRTNHILRISAPGKKNSVYRNGWLNRLFKDKQGTSNLAYMVITTENFFLNAKGMCQFTPAEKEHCARKAAIYKTTSITLPV